MMRAKRSSMRTAFDAENCSPYSSPPAWVLVCAVLFYLIVLEKTVQRRAIFFM